MHRLNPISLWAQVNPVFSTSPNCNGDMDGGAAIVLVDDLKTVAIAPVDHLVDLVDQVSPAILSQGCCLACLVLLRGNNLTSVLQMEVSGIKCGKIYFS